MGKIEMMPPDGARVEAGPPLATALSPHSQVMGEVGKALLLDSLDSGKQFCKSMIGIANGAIPVYLGLLGFMAPKDYRPTFLAGLVAMVPTILFLAASVAFAYGYFPHVRRFNLDLPNQVNDVHTETVERRERLARLGFLLFCVGLLLAVPVTIGLAW